MMEGFISGGIPLVVVPDPRLLVLHVISCTSSFVDDPPHARVGFRHGCGLCCDLLLAAEEG